MDRSTVIGLVSLTHTQDDIGQYTATETNREVLAEMRSVSQSEWFEAGRNGLKPSICFVMFRDDYNGEKIITHYGKRYGIYRTYVNESEQIELYCEEKGGLDENTSN